MLKECLEKLFYFQTLPLRYALRVSMEGTRTILDFHRRVLENQQDADRALEAQGQEQEVEDVPAPPPEPVWHGDAVRWSSKIASAEDRKLQKMERSDVGKIDACF